jgi:hypothetical protein
MNRKKDEARVRSNPPADYHSLIARLVSELADNAPDARQALYERARVALATQLPHLSGTWRVAYRGSAMIMSERFGGATMNLNGFAFRFAIATLAASVCAATAYALLGRSRKRGRKGIRSSDQTS